MEKRKQIIAEIDRLTEEKEKKAEELLEIDKKIYNKNFEISNLWDVYHYIETRIETGVNHILLAISLGVIGMPIYAATFLFLQNIIETQTIVTFSWATIAGLISTCTSMMMLEDKVRDFYVKNNKKASAMHEQLGEMLKKIEDRDKELELLRSQRMGIQRHFDELQLLIKDAQDMLSLIDNEEKIVQDEEISLLEEDSKENSGPKRVRKKEDI